ncbi:MAG: AAA family ATPase [Acidobacteriota bacterium]
MIVRKIVLEHFGRFLEPCELELSPEEPNLLAGPNGSGKSTVLAALTSAFTVSATSAAQEIKRWQPWQRALHPRVMVEFEHGGLLWRLRKEFAFGARGTALLECRQAGQWLPQAQGRHVEERLPEFLGAAGGGTGSWLVAGVLWARQNELAELRLDQPLQDRVRASLGAQIRSGPVAVALREAEQRFLEDWTPTGRPGANSPLRQLEDRVAGLREEAGRIRERLEQLGKDRTAFEDLTSEAGRLEAEMQRLEQRQKELQQQSQQKAELEKRRLQIQNTLQAARAEYTAVETILNQRRTIAADLQAAAQQVDDLTRRLEAGRQAVRAAEDALVQARASVAARIAGLESELNRLQAPPRQTLDEAARLDQQLRELEARLESAMLHVQFELERDARIEVLRGEPKGPVESRAGQSVTISGSPEIELAVQGLGRVRIWGPAAGVAELQQQIAAVQAQRQPLLQRWEGETLEALEEKRRQADDLERQLGELRRQRQAHEDQLSPEALALRQARREAEGLETRLREAQQSRDRAEERRRRLDEDPRDEAALRAAAQQAAQRIAAAEAEREQVAQGLALLPVELDTTLEQAGRELETARRRREQALEIRNVLRGRIEERQGEGLYAQLAAAEESLAEAEAEYAAADLRAKSNKLLWHTLKKVFEEAERLILPGLERRTTEVLARVQGDAFRGVRLDPNSWTPRAVHPAAVEAPMEVAPDRISGGEQEQLYLALRLALADILTEEQPQLVVLDDVLLATDAARLSRILALIEERRRRMQFLILTCHPERFSELSGARLVHLGGRNAAA